LVVGVPKGPDVLGPGAGLVDVHDRDGGPPRVIRPGSLGQAEAVGDRFGAAIVSADFNGDRCLDLVVGAPGTGGVGAVYVVYGSPAGVGSGAVIRLPYAGSAGDAFGAALAVDVDLKTSGLAVATIWVGAPGRDVSGNVDAGALVRYTLTAGAVSTPTVLTQNTPGVPGAAEPGDRFGQVLAPVDGGVLVGQPREDVGTVVDAGMVTLLPAPSGGTVRLPRAITEDSPGIAGKSETGDHFGAALSGGEGQLNCGAGDPRWCPDVAVVGVPDEDLGSIRDTGMVHAIPLDGLTTTDNFYISQDSPGVPGAAEAGDRFGASVQHGVVNSLGSSPLCDPFGYAIGAPGEGIGNVTHAGAITMYVSKLGPPSLCPSGVYHRGSDARPSDGLGASLGLLLGLATLSGDPNAPITSLAVGSPGEAIGAVPDAGVVEILYPSDFPDIESSYTMSTGSHAGTRYGSVISKTASCKLCFNLP
jgi:FG-GAP repeat protein